MSCILLCLAGWAGSIYLLDFGLDKFSCLNCLGLLVLIGTGAWAVPSRNGRAFKQHSSLRTKESIIAMTSIEPDVIIVGGGTAGLVIASRLSEHPDIEVLILEAGRKHNENPQVVTPALWPGLIGTEADWAFRTVGQVCDMIHYFH